jgi:phosphoribosylaminoimidazole carboxylase (NCAIR synthetase)
MKQTATDYFYDRMLKLFIQYHEEDVPTIDFSEIITDAFEQAKAIEERQIIDAHDSGYIDGQGQKSISAEQYYNETYDTRGIH